MPSAFVDLLCTEYTETGWTLGLHPAYCAIVYLCVDFGIVCKAICAFCNFSKDSVSVSLADSNVEGRKGQHTQHAHPQPYAKPHLRFYCEYMLLGKLLIEYLQYCTVGSTQGGGGLYRSLHTRNEKRGQYKKDASVGRACLTPNQWGRRTQQHKRG